MTYVEGVTFVGRSSLVTAMSRFWPPGGPRKIQVHLTEADPEVGGAWGAHATPSGLSKR